MTPRKPRSPLRLAVAVAAAAGLLVAAACSHGVDGATGPADASAASDDAAPTTIHGASSGAADAASTEDGASGVASSGGGSIADDGGGGSQDGSASGIAPAPVLVSIAPQSAFVGTTGPTIVCTGSSFVARSVVQVNGVALPTAFVSSTELRATLPTASLATVGALAVTVGTGPPGGGGSSEQDFAVVNPAPTLTSLAPTSALLGASDTPLTVTGAQFVTGASIGFNGAALPTTVTSATQASATIPAAQLATSGTYRVTITNPAPGGGASPSIAFTVANPTVTVTSVTPQTLLVGSAATPIALVGTGFLAASAVSFNGTTIASTFTDAQHLSATVPAGALAIAGSFPVVVTNPSPGGGVSTPVQVDVVYAAPTATLLSPSSVLVGAAPATVTVTGSGFVAGQTTIAFDGSALLTSVVDSSHASATLTTAQMQVAHAFQVTVTNPTPGGGTSSPLAFDVDDPVPVATSVTPSTALIGASATPVTIAGSNFVASSTVSLGGTALPTTFNGNTSLGATIPASDLTAPATLSLTVTNGGPGGGTSSAVSFVVDDPAAAITQITPSSTVVPGADTPVTVTGTGFLASSTVDLGGSPLATTFNGPTSLGATIPAASLAAAGTLSVTVVNPPPGGGTSNAAFFTASDPVPTLTSLSTSAIFAGSSATPITLTGTGFVGASVVHVNGTAIATTFGGATSLGATIPSADLAAPATLTVTVTNPAPGGGTTAGLPIAVSCNTAAATIVLTALNQTTTETLNYTGAPSANRITTSEEFGSQPDYCPPQYPDSSAQEPYVGYVVMNATAHQATLEAWAVCHTTDDGYLTFYSQSTLPTASQLPSCTGVVAEGAGGSGGFASKSPGTSNFCPGLTKANGGGLSLPACGIAVVLLQPWSTTSTSYTPPTTLAVDLQ